MWLIVILNYSMLEAQERYIETIRGWNERFITGCKRWNEMNNTIRFQYLYGRLRTKYGVHVYGLNTFNDIAQLFCITTPCFLSDYRDAKGRVMLWVFLLYEALQACWFLRYDDIVVFKLWYVKCIFQVAAPRGFSRFSILRQDFYKSIKTNAKASGHFAKSDLFEDTESSQV